jgi:FixJ family two-component response regulator
MFAGLPPYFFPLPFIPSRQGRGSIAEVYPPRRAGVGVRRWTVTEEKPFVYVVDDDPSVRKALERLLRSAGHDAKTFASALEFLDFNHPDAPGCLILDIKMPKVSGLELQDRLAAKGISFPIIFITGHGTVPASVRAFKAGAMDFLQKPFEDGKLLGAVSRGIEKHSRLRQKQKEMKTLRSRLETLTPREREVFKLVVSGILNKQIAFELGTTEKTIKVHRGRVMEKMGAASLADLVRFAEKLVIGSSWA